MPKWHLRDGNFSFQKHHSILEYLDMQFGEKYQTRKDMIKSDDKYSPSLPEQMTFVELVLNQVMEGLKDWVYITLGLQHVDPSSLRDYLSVKLKKYLKPNKEVTGTSPHTSKCTIEKGKYCH